jgi:hypothetical protein
MPPTTLLVLGVTVMSGVAAFIVDRTEPWPDDVPPRASYDRIWESDPRLRQSQTREQYLAGILRFHSGSVWVPGWNRRRSEILVALGPDRASDLDQLGFRICSEWAKPESLRRISSRTLALWGDALRNARDPDQLESVLDRIRDDVGMLLQGGLEPSALTPQRYALLALTKERSR